MNLDERQEMILSLICSRGGGIKVKEIEERTNLSYKEIIDTARNLIAKGYYIRGIGVSDWIERLFLSPYDSKYKTLIKMEDDLT